MAILHAKEAKLRAALALKQARIAAKAKEALRKKLAAAAIISARIAK